MSRRQAIPNSPAFDAISDGAQFRDRIAIVVKASPGVVFRKLREITLPDMMLAWCWEKSGICHRGWRGACRRST